MAKLNEVIVKICDIALLTSSLLSTLNFFRSLLSISSLSRLRFLASSLSLSLLFSEDEEREDLLSPLECFLCFPKKLTQLTQSTVNMKSKYWVAEN